MNATQFLYRASFSSFVQHADHEEKCSGRKTVIDHLQHSPFQALRGESEDAENYEAHVGY